MKHPDTPSSYLLRPMFVIGAINGEGGTKKVRSKHEENPWRTNLDYAAQKLIFGEAKRDAVTKKMKNRGWHVLGYVFVQAMLPAWYKIKEPGLDTRFLT